MIKVAKNLLKQAGNLIKKYTKRVLELIIMSINPRHQTNNLANQKRKIKQAELEKRELVSNKVSSDLRIDVEFDELTGIVYLMLNRTSFAITLEEFAKLSSSITEAYVALIEHPNIILTSAQDEFTKVDTEEFLYIHDDEDEFVN